MLELDLLKLERKPILFRSREPKSPAERVLNAHTCTHIYSLHPNPNQPPTHTDTHTHPHTHTHTHTHTLSEDIEASRQPMQELL